MGRAGGGALAIAHALAAEIGWRVVADPRALHAMVARTLGRREHLIITSAPIAPDDQQTVRGELPGVRFVDLAEQRGDADAIVRDIRREFGF